MNRNLNRDPFEEFIKDSLDNHEVEFNESHWQELEQRLNDNVSDSKSNENKSYNTGNVFKAIGLVVIASATTYFVTENFLEDKTEIKLKNEIIHTVPLGSLNDNKTVDAKDQVEIIPNNQAIVDDVNPVVNNDINTVKPSQSTMVPAQENQLSSNNIADQAKNDGINKHSNLDNLNENNSSEIVDAEFSINVVEGCGAAEVRFTPNTLNEAYNYSWFFGDGKESVVKNSTHIYDKPGVYSATLVLTSKADPSKVFTAGKQEIVVNNKPKADFDWVNNSTGGALKYAISYQDNSEGASKFLWNFGDNSFSNEKNPNHNYFSKGTYLVELTVTNEAGCQDKKSDYVSIKENNELLAPTAFSPDGDNINDYFIPKGLEVMDVEFEMLVYDLNGNLVFKTNDYTKPWSGANQSGKSYQGGTSFSWVVNTKDKNGEVQTHKGLVSIIK